MNTRPLKLVAADAGSDGIARLIQIGLDFGLAQPPHGHACDLDFFKYYLAVARHGNGGAKLVAVAGELTQLFRSLGPVNRLTEKPGAQGQSLVRADDILGWSPC